MEGEEWEVDGRRWEWFNEPCSDVFYKGKGKDLGDLEGFEKDTTHF